MKRLVIGLTAHVDSGKTTLAEAILYKTGTVRKAGRVDHGDAFLDTHEIEKKRGITVFSKQAAVKFDGSEYFLLDTPGHTDFSAETERAFSVMDCAILVISGSEGVQSHTETLWSLLKRYGVPVFVFVNKTDIAGFDKEAVLPELGRRLSDRITDVTQPADKLYEAAALCSEALMEEYLGSGELSDAAIGGAVLRRELFPCLFGSALKMTGIEGLLSALSRFMPEPARGESFGARVYKITASGTSRLTHLKITGGALKVRDTIEYRGLSEKINRIMIFSGDKSANADEAPAGTLCTVTGLSAAKAGDGLGAEISEIKTVLEPVLSYRVLLPEGEDAFTVMTRLKKLEEEDPRLGVTWNEHTKEINVRLMGEIQLEILRELMRERFGTDISFGGGSIAYKETIAEPCEGVGHYEPLRHYAEVHLLMEPLPGGSGLVFAADCPEEVLGASWQRLVLTHLAEKTHVGVLTGSPITDMKITLKLGKAHLKHTEGGDFRQATYRAVRMGLMSAKSVLLEPWYSFTLEVPGECVGRALSDLTRMEAKFEPPGLCGELSVIKGTAPVAAMRGYHTDTAGYTGGRGRLSCTVCGYYPCRDQGSVAAAVGYSPESDLDNSADSVFCSHGAGFAVKWNEVPRYMHLESCIKPKAEEKAAPVAAPGRAPTVYDEKELTAIFERTYGKIKRDPRSYMHTEKKPEKEYGYKPRITGKEYLLIDGYNIIFAWEELSRLAQDNLELARSTLINAMCNYRGFISAELIIVFDAYRVKGSVREVEQVGNITVIYTKEAETADMFIEKAAHELGKQNRVRVATSDRLEQIIILGSGAYRMSASEFREEVMAAEKAIRAAIAENNAANRLSGAEPREIKGK